MIRINENIVVPHQFEEVKSTHSQTVGRFALSYAPIDHEQFYISKVSVESSFFQNKVSHSTQ